jgi:hypothetical protein
MEEKKYSGIIRNGFSGEEMNNLSFNYVSIYRSAYKHFQAQVSKE